MARFLPFLLILALQIFCLVDVITADEDRVRHLPKIAWFLLILLFPLVGAVVWLLAGRPQTARYPGRSSPRAPGAGTAYSEYDRPGRAVGATPESDEEFLRRVRERAEEQRRKAAEEKRRREAEGDGE